MKKTIKIVSLLFIMTLMMFTGIKKVDAATGSITISSYSSVTIGNTINVTITGRGSKIFYWQLYVSYDSSKLQLISGNTTIQGEADDATNGTSSFSQTLKFKALSIGTGKISVSMGNAAMNIDSNFNYISYPSVSKNISIVAPVVLSSNNYLTGLTVDSYTISPEFNKDNLNYTVELEPDTTNIVVNTVKEDGKSTVSVSGNVTVVDGVNNIPIIVTAENGATRTYNLVATVKEYEPIEVVYNKDTYTVVRKKASLTAPSGYTETAVKINDTDVPAFISEITKYTLVGLKDQNSNIKLFVYNQEKNTYEEYKELVFKSAVIFPMELTKDKIPLGYEKSTMSYNDQIITSYKLNSTSKYSLIYGMNVTTGNINIYMYDSVENTVQIYNREELEQANKNNNLYLKIIIGLSALSFILFISLLITIIKKNKNKKINFDSEDIIKTKKESKIKSILFDEETRTEKNDLLNNKSNLKKLEKITKKEEKKKQKLEKKNLKEEKKNSKKEKIKHKKK